MVDSLCLKAWKHYYVQHVTQRTWILAATICHLLRLDVWLLGMRKFSMIQFLTDCFQSIRQRVAHHLQSVKVAIANNKLWTVKNWYNSGQPPARRMVITSSPRGSQIGRSRLTHRFLMSTGNMPYCQDCTAGASWRATCVSREPWPGETRFFPDTINLSNNGKMTAMLAEPQSGMFGINRRKSFIHSCNIIFEIWREFLENVLLFGVYIIGSNILPVRDDANLKQFYFYKTWYRIYMLHWNIIHDIA